MSFLQVNPDRNRVFFIDEAGFQVSMRVRYGRAPAGTRANVATTALRTKNYSLCAALTWQSVALFEVQNHPYNKLSFEAFLLKLVIQLQTQQVQGATFILDNVAFHRSSEIAALVRAHGHSLLFLPPYSPFLNPIENAFSQWKQHVRRTASRNEVQLIAAIQSASTQISANDCAGYYRYMERYLPLCLERTIIEN
jgi:transposase